MSSERERERDRDRRTTAMILTAESLKEFTVLRGAANQQGQRRVNKEAHPKAVLSTKKKQDDSAADPRGCSAPCDCTTPVNSTTRKLTAQVVSSPRCLVTRQPSTPVDLPPAATQDNPQATQQVVVEQSTNRPATLGFRSHSNSSDSSGATPCPIPPSPGDGRQLGSSYPPGPARVQQCYEASHGDGYMVRLR